MPTVIDKIHITVTYPAAGKPFQDDSASFEETLQSLKDRVLDAFGLKEGQTPDGNVATYTFYRGKDPLSDLTQTIGDISGGKPALQLKLSQQIVQGACV